jgi:1-phosphatidylinositol-3-phosphate 5-kinase
MDQKPTEKVPNAKASAESAKSKETDPARLLSDLRHTFQGTERVLYAQLARTQVGSLNDVRWSFRSTARVAVKRLSAWENKHLPGEARSQIRRETSITQPDWWETGCHAVPGGNVFVREDDWGSIIAYTLRYFSHPLSRCIPDM